MTDREKLIELLHKGVRCPGTVEVCEYDCPYWSVENACDAFAATADMLISHGVTFATDKNVGDNQIDFDYEAEG